MAIIRQTFFQECEEQLQALEEGLMLMEEGEASSEVINSVFRAVHSIKGGAGAFKLEALVSFAHSFETVLDQIRAEKLAASSDVTRLLLRASDILADLVAASREGEAININAHSDVLAELDRTSALNEQQQPEEDGDDFADMGFTPTTILIDETPKLNELTLHFHPHKAMLARANEPILFIRQLKELGEIKCSCDTCAVPLIDSFKCGESYFKFEITLSTTQSINAVQEVFSFVDDVCDLTISTSEAAAAPPLEVLAVVPAPPAPAVEQQADSRSVEQQVSPLAAGEADKEKSAPQKVAAASATIRVELDRVDRLINLVGELVINQAMLAQRIEHAILDSGENVSASLEELDRLTRELQDSVMAIRAQPVKSLFQRMARIVREVAAATGKNVRLRLEGEATEVDKTVIESLADPLTHMIRNAVDHGLETPEDRAKVGKPEEGTIKLMAAHQSGKVVITIADDGGGIDRPRVLAIAKRKGLIPADAKLSDGEIDNLLFMPGFSTAESVSAISGRGVGMDVVRRSIQALGGRIAINSSAGKGSAFTLSLPLTLAVLDGIVIALDDQIFVVPLTSVVETLQPSSSNILELSNGGYALRVRERLVPVVDVGASLGIRETKARPYEHIAILVDMEGGRRGALLVDRIVDQRQVVIKSFEQNYRPVPGVAAATILGDGRVAMILDVETISLQGMLASSREDAAFAKAV